MKRQAANPQSTVRRWTLLVSTAILPTRLLALQAADATPSSPAPYDRPGATMIVSVASNGMQGNSPAESAFGGGPAVSGDGSRVAFVSGASNLVPGDTNTYLDVFVRDTRLHATERVSVSSAGAQGDGASGGCNPPECNDTGTVALSADGRYVAFVSSATNLVPGDTNGGQDVFVHDLLRGTTERVSLRSDGSQVDEHSASGNISSAAAWCCISISGDGRLVAFSYKPVSDPLASAPPGSTLFDGHGAGFYVHDRLSRTTRWIGSADSLEHSRAALSKNGRYLAVAEVIPGIGGSVGPLGIFVYDLRTLQRALVTVATDGGDPNAPSDWPAISADGRFVAFQSSATNLVPDDTNDAGTLGPPGSTPDIFVRDLAAGVTRRASVNSAGAEANDLSAFPAISADGRIVAFESRASNLVPDDTNQAADTFIHDMQSGATERVSVTVAGRQGNGFSTRPAISADGRYVAFSSTASNLVPGYLTSADYFVRDRGGALGIGGLAADQSRRGWLRLSGWATFSGVDLADRHDPTGDATSSVASPYAGADIVRARVTYRPEDADLLLQLELRALPTSIGAAPSVVYLWEFSVGGVRYQVRSSRVGAGPQASPPSPPPAGGSIGLPPTSSTAYFVLDKCTPQCAPVLRLDGGIGTVQSGVSVAVPLAAVNGRAGSQFTTVVAATAGGDPNLESVETLDSVDVSASAVIPTIGVSAKTTSQRSFVPASLSHGQYTVSLRRGSGASLIDILMRTCVGGACTATVVSEGR